MPEIDLTSRLSREEVGDAIAKQFAERAAKSEDHAGVIRQKDAEIERLSIENEKWRLCREFIPTEKEEMAAEIERLRTVIEPETRLLREEIADILRAVREARCSGS